MKNWFYILLLTIISVHGLAQGQNNLDYVPESDRIIFGNEDWKLVYGNENLLIDHMTILGNRILISELLPSGNYRISFLNEDNTIEKNEIIKIKHNYIPISPHFFSDDKNLYFGPLYDRQIQLSTNKQKISNTIKYRTKKTSEFYKKTFYFKDYIFESYCTLDRKTNRLNFVINSLTEGIKYSNSLKSSMLLYSDYADYIQIAPVETASNFLILDNISKKMMWVSGEGKLKKRYDLEEKTNYPVIQYKLAIDDYTGKMYLFPLFNSDYFYLLANNEDDLVLKKIKKDRTLALHYAIVYNNHIYNLFNISKINSNAIYKTKININ